MTADKLELIRQQSMEQYGFGPAAMKKVKVCTVCGNPSPSDQQFCTECGHRLPLTRPCMIYIRKGTSAAPTVIRCCPTKWATVRSAERK